MCPEKNGIKRRFYEKIFIFKKHGLSNVMSTFKATLTVKSADFYIGEASTWNETFGLALK